MLFRSLTADPFAPLARGGRRRPDATASAEGRRRRRPRAKHQVARPPASVPNDRPLHSRTAAASFPNDRPSRFGRPRRSRLDLTLWAARSFFRRVGCNKFKAADAPEKATCGPQRSVEGRRSRLHVTRGRLRPRASGPWWRSTRQTSSRSGRASWVGWVPMAEAEGRWPKGRGRRPMAEGPRPKGRGRRPMAEAPRPRGPGAFRRRRGCARWPSLRTAARLRA